MIDVKKLTGNLSDFRSDLSNYLTSLQQNKELLIAQHQYEQAAAIERILNKVKGILKRINELQSTLPDLPKD